MTTARQQRHPPVAYAPGRRPPRRRRRSETNTAPVVRAPLSEDERLDTLGRLLADTEIPMPHRVAGIIDFYGPPSPVPAPVGSMLLEHIANRDNMDTATNRHPAGSSPAAGQVSRSAPSTCPHSSTRSVSRLQLPAAPLSGSNSWSTPAPVVADALGYHDKATTRLRNETGGTWSRYAPEITHGHRWWVLGEPVTVEYESPPVHRHQVRFERGEMWCVRQDECRCRQFDHAVTLRSRPRFAKEVGTVTSTAVTRSHPVPRAPRI